MRFAGGIASYFELLTADVGENDDYINLIRDDASRTLMGSRQENWFYNQLSDSADRGATWRIVGNQIIFSRIVESFGVNGDNWNVRHRKSLSSHVS